MQPIIKSVAEVYQLKFSICQIELGIEKRVLNFKSKKFSIKAKMLVRK